MLKTLGVVSWGNIAIGEVFADWDKLNISYISVKETESRARVLACSDTYFDAVGMRFDRTECGPMHKLSKSTQCLWLTV